MENNIAQKLTAFTTILALPFALGAFVLAWAPAQQFYLSDPTYDGFVQPRSISKLVETTQDSTVTVFVIMALRNTLKEQPLPCS